MSIANTHYLMFTSVVLLRTHVTYNKKAFLGPLYDLNFYQTNPNLSTNASMWIKIAVSVACPKLPEEHPLLTTVVIPAAVDISEKGMESSFCSFPAANCYMHTKYTYQVVHQIWAEVYVGWANEIGVAGHY